MIFEKNKKGQIKIFCKDLVEDCLAEARKNGLKLSMYKGTWAVEFPCRERLAWLGDLDEFVDYFVKLALKRKIFNKKNEIQPNTMIIENGRLIFFRRDI